LTRKLAEHVDGVDLSHYRVGDVLDLPQRQAELLLAERWAQPVRDPQSSEIGAYSSALARAEVADMQRFADRMRRVGEQIDLRQFEPNVYRRIEDRFRDELHDAHARVVQATTRTGGPVGPRAESSQSDGRPPEDARGPKRSARRTQGRRGRRPR
jgi:hypothetical protein